jgi:hypothetical protein
MAVMQHKGALIWAGKCSLFAQSVSHIIFVIQRLVVNRLQGFEWEISHPFHRRNHPKKVHILRKSEKRISMIQSIVGV